MKQTILHFGAGALGKGLVIPVLHESDCQVIVVDADTNLVDFLQKEKAYTMYIPDEFRLRPPAIWRTKRRSFLI